MFLMWGYEGETLEDIAATVEHVRLSDPDVFLTTVSYPIMNTSYYRTVADRVVPTRPWDEASDRDYVVRGRPRRAYYQEADRWLKGEVAAARLEGTDPAAAARERTVAAAARQAMAALASDVEA
jgi:hypothetical protein